MSAEVDGILVSGTVAVHKNNKGTHVDCWLDGQTGEDNTHSSYIIPVVEYVLMLS